LSEAQRLAARPNRGQALERGQVLPWHVLVIERDHVTGRAEGQHVLCRSVASDLSVGADLSRAVGGAIGENPELDAETDRGLRRHPCELASPHHPDDGLAVTVQRGGRLLNAHSP
jgi:hypothetical protein